MAKVNCKEIRERGVKINDAWKEGAASVNFGGVKQTSYEAKIAAAEAADEEIEDLEAQLKMKKTARDAQYANIDDDSVMVRKGVIGDPAFGDDSPLYAAMGFIIKSLRASGLTRKKRDSQ